MPKNNLKFADEFAGDYDNSVLKNNWIGTQVIFDLCEKLLSSQAQILDLGIGTGESSFPFQKIGHVITGLDGSEKMLDQCKSKHIGSVHIHHDLEKTPFTIKDNLFDAVISNGVFHLIHPIKPIFSEVKRIVKPGGIFAFTFESSENISGSTEIEKGVWQKETESGVLTYKHNSVYIQEILRDNSFTIISEKQFLAFVNKQSKTKFYFTAIVARLQ